MTPQQLNEWRIVPRLLVLGYGFVFYNTIEWYMALPEPNNAQAAFVSTVVGAGAAFFNFYVNSGKTD